MTFPKLLFCSCFALLQVIVFEEQEADGRIEFSSSPDYGVPVYIQ